MENVGGITMTSWALTDIARTSIVHGNEFRNTVPESKDILRLCAAYNDLDDPDLAAGAEDAVTSFFLRVASEQFPHQGVGINSMSRSASLFLHTTPKKTMQVIRSGWDEELFACSLEDFISIGYFLQLSAGFNGGTFDESLLDQPDLKPVTDMIPAKRLLEVARSNYYIDTSSFKRRNASTYREGPYRRYSYNPFLERPFITGVTKNPVTPASGVASFRYSTLGIYHSGVQHFGNRFADDVGDLFEQYTGRNLRLLDGASVIPSITYRSGQNESVDWIVVFEDLVVLIEVKSVRPTDPVRLGLPGAKDEVKRMLGRAFHQLQATSALIDQSSAEFAQVPSGLRRVGIVVTLEDFHILNTPFHRSWLPTSNSLPILIASIDELEHLVCLDRPVEGILAWFDDPQHAGANLRSVIHGREGGRNPVVDAGFATNTWLPSVKDAHDRRLRDHHGPAD